jgi:hypothetical protein
MTHSSNHRQSCIVNGSTMRAARPAGAADRAPAAAARLRVLSGEIEVRAAKSPNIASLSPQELPKLALKNGLNSQGDHP